MNEETVQSVERLLFEKALRYAELVECFKRGRACLTNLEIESLWTVSEEKKRLCAQIEALRSRIALAGSAAEGATVYDSHRILDAVPAAERGPVRSILLRIQKLKKEVELMRQENRAFIDDSLDFLDEMISILSGEGGAQMLYNNRSRLRRPESLVTLSREV
jgi:hypothetical protein